MNKLPKDTNGEWERVKGTDTVHRGDYVPLEGIKGQGSANVYFNGYTTNQHYEKKLYGKARTLMNIVLAILFFYTFGSFVYFYKSSFLKCFISVFLGMVLIFASMLIGMKYASTHVPTEKELEEDRRREEKKKQRNQK